MPSSDHLAPSSRPRSRGRTRQKGEPREAVDLPSVGSRGRRSASAPSVSAKAAVKRITALAALADSLESRDAIRSLAAHVRRGSGDAQRMAFCESAIGDCIDEAAQAEAQAVRWLRCEAATWALAWLARTRRAGGSAGRLLERLVGQARGAQPLLGRGDTQSASFVLALARLFCDVEACRCLGESATSALAAEIERLTTPAGVVAVSDSRAMIDRVVRWTRAREIALATGEPAWQQATERRWKAAATTALRLLGGGGRTLAGAGRLPNCFTAPLVTAADELGGRRRRTVERLLRNRRDDARRPGDLGRDLHDPEAAMAILRTGWGRSGVRVLLDYRHAVPRLEIAVADRLLVDGPWQWEAWAAGRALEVEGGWTVSCFESDRKATFLEITAPLSGGLQLERQVVLLPRDGVLVCADAITSAGASLPADLRYRGMLTLGASLDAVPEEETTEVVLSDTDVRAVALPLAVPEWRGGARGRLDAVDGGLVLTQEGRGGRLYAPLWLDCTAARIGRPRTWRQLTVAETRRQVPDETAVGFRVQAGIEQWLLYRSLDTPRNRTLLGCNVSCEFLLGRVKDSGEVARTLEIQ